MSTEVSAKTVFDDGKRLTEAGEYLKASHCFTEAWNRAHNEKNEKLTAVSLKMLGDLYRLLKQVQCARCSHRPASPELTNCFAVFFFFFFLFLSSFP